MKRFIKKNLIFIIVLSVALLIALGLLVVVIVEHSRMQGNFRQAQTLRDQIAELIKKEPAPVAGNIDPIEQEIEIYQQKTEEIKRYFVGVKQPALDAFAKALGMTYPEFYQKFREAWEAEGNKEALGWLDRFYESLRRRWKNWDVALEAFAVEYQKVTAEKVTPGNRKDILLAALGVPRRMNGDLRSALTFVTQMRARMLEIFGEQEPRVELTGTASSFSFETFQQMPPAPEQIPNVVKNWEVIGDLGTRIAKSGLKSLDSFKKRGLEGERVGDYVVYHYSFGVTGDYEKVQKLVTDLHAAIEENRFYIVRSVFLYASRDGAGEIFEARRLEEERARLEVEAAASGAAAAEAGTPDPGMMPGMMPGRRPPRGRMMDPGMMGMDPMMDMGMGGVSQAELERQAMVKRREEIMKLPYNERPGYGMTLIGGSDSCEAVIDVEYIVLAEPELN